MTSTRSVESLVSDLVRAGAEIWNEGGELRFRAPRGAISPELRAEVAERRPEILALLGEGRRILFLSASQERMWYADRVDPGNPAYNIPFSAARVDGPLSVDRLRQTLAELWVRHEPLRASFPSYSGAPVQVLGRPEDIEVPFVVVDLTDVLPENRNETVERLGPQETQRPFDLAHGPLLRCCLLRFAEDDSILVVTMHHIIADVWSMPVFLRELAARYRALARELPSPLMPLPVTHRDFLHAQRQRQSERMDGDLAYFRAQLAGAPVSLPLAPDRPREAGSRAPGSHCALAIDPELTAGIETLARAEGATTFSLLLAALDTLLFRVTGETDLIVGVPVAGREEPGLGGIVGLCADTLVVRTDLSGNPTLREVVARQRDVVLAALAHGEAPLVRLVAAMSAGRQGASVPFGQVLFDFLAEAPTQEYDLGDATMRSLPLDRGVTDVELFFIVYRVGGGLEVWAEYRSDLFEPGTIQRLLDDYAHILRALVANPDRRIRNLEISSETASAPQADHEAESLDRVLRSRPGIADVAVRRRSGSLVAYVVPSGPLLDTSFGSVPAMPIVPMVPIAAIPLTATGAVDRRTLESLAVLDPAVLARWKDRLSEIPEVADSAVVLIEAVYEHPRFALPDLEPVPVPTSCRRSEVTGGPLESELGEPRTLLEALERSASLVPDRAIVHVQPDGSANVSSYAALLEEARCIGGGLAERGVAANDRVLLVLDRSADVLPAFWGVLAASAVPVVLGPGTTEKISRSWEFLDRPLIVVEAAEADRLAETFAGRIVTIESLRDALALRTPSQARPEDVALLTLSSGSTGSPKCIQLTHTSLLARAAGTNALCSFSSEDVVLNWLPFDHIGSLSDWHLRPVLLGCKLVDAPKEFVLASPTRWLDLIETHRVTHSWAPTFAFGLVVEALARGPQATWDLSGVKGLVCAGESVSSKALHEFATRLKGSELRENSLIPAFGMAELGSGVTYRTSGARRFRVTPEGKGSAVREVSASERSGRGLVCVELGPPIPGVSLRIVGAGDRVLTERSVGRLHAKGEVLFAGYERDAGASRAAFSEDGWFDTGDLGFLIDGSLVLTGREKETLVVNGVNTPCVEIERAVEEILGVESSCTAACSVREPGGETERVAVFFVPGNGSDAALLAPLIRERLAIGSGMKPDELIALAPDEIPRTAIGKIRRSELSRRFEEGAFEGRSLRAKGGLRLAAAPLPLCAHRIVWRPRLLRCDERPVATRTLILSGPDDRLAEALAQELEKRGGVVARGEAGPSFRALGSRRYRLDLCDPDSMRRLLDELTADNFPVDAIVHLGAHGAPAQRGNPDRTWDDLRETSLRELERGALSLLALGRALAGSLRNGQIRLLVVSSRSQSTGQEPLDPDRALLPPLVLALGQENPFLDVTHVDLQEGPATIAAQRLAAELATLDGEREVAYRNGRRLVARLIPAAVARPMNAAPFRKGTLYLVTGGLGALGMEICRPLLRDAGVRLLVVGRRPADDSECVAALRELSSLGDIEYRTADVTDLPALRVAVHEAKVRTGERLDGVLHLAGAYAERPLVEETPESLRAALSAKVLGGWALHELLRGEPGGDRLFIGFSSLAGTFSGALIGAYAAANRFLDALSLYQREERGLRGVSIGWSPWPGLGVSRGQEAFAAASLRARGFEPILPDAGLHAFFAAASGALGPGPLLIGLDPRNPNVRRRSPWKASELPLVTARGVVAARTAFDPELTFEDAFGREVSLRVTVLEGGSLPRSEDGELDREALGLETDGTPAVRRPSAPPRTDLERAIAAIWKDLLQVDRVSVEDNFFDLGGHSILVFQVQQRLSKIAGAECTMLDLFRCPTVSSLAAFLAGRSTPAVNHEEVLVRAEARRAGLRRQRDARDRRERDDA